MEEKGIIIDEAGVLAPWDEKREREKLNTSMIYPLKGDQR